MEPFIGQIIMFGGNFAPRGWAFCDGQLLPISSYSALFSILGTTYGGDGRTTFALPDLRGRAPIHEGQGPGLTSRRLGQKGGSERRTLTVNELPSHNHGPAARAGAKTLKSVRGNRGDTPTIVDGTTQNIGGSRPVDVMQPYLAVNYIIALQGVFPSRS